MRKPWPNGGLCARNKQTKTPSLISASSYLQSNKSGHIKRFKHTLIKPLYSESLCYRKEWLFLGIGSSTMRIVCLSHVASPDTKINPDEKQRKNILLLLRLVRVKICSQILGSDIHMSVHRNIIPNYSQQDATFLDIFLFIDALHVSDGSSAHHQEHTTVHTASDIVNQYCC